MYGMAIHLLLHSCRSAWRLVRVLALGIIWLILFTQCIRDEPSDSLFHNLSRNHSHNPALLTDVGRIWDVVAGHLGWAVNMRVILITDREKGPQFTQNHLACSLGSCLIWNYCLISQREEAKPAASGQPSSYLHYCPFSLRLSLDVTFISSYSVTSLSLPALSHFFSLSCSVCLFVSIFQSPVLTARQEGQ